MTNTSITEFKSSNFDEIDVFYLANAFTIDELKHEIANCKRWFPYEDWHADFVAACEEGIRWQRSRQPKPTPGPNSKFIDVEALKRNLDIVDIADRYTKLRKAGHNFTGLCPFHSEKRPSFMVYPEKQSWHCFGACNIGGDAISLVMKAENVDFKGAIERLAR